MRGIIDLIIIPAQGVELSMREWPPRVVRGTWGRKPVRPGRKPAPLAGYRWLVTAGWSASSG
jgi:hypothetical protein